MQQQRRTAVPRAPQPDRPLLSPYRAGRGKQRRQEGNQKEYTYGWVRKENRKMDMAGNRKDNRVERTPREEERKGKMRHRKREEDKRGSGSTRERKSSQTGAGLHLPVALSLCLCPSCLSERSDRGMAPVHRLKARSPLSTGRRTHAGLCSALQRFLCHFFHFASALVPL